jgi:hypothetical protein
MGKYQDIATLIEQSVPDYTSLKVVPRGTPIFQDLLMTGQMRFARRTGANFAALNPDNQFYLTADAQVSDDTLQVDNILTWLEENALITFNQTEMLEVQTWDPTASTIMLNSTLGTMWPAGSTISLWATPMVVHFDSPAGTQQIYVRSRYALVNGDSITLPIAGTLNSLQEIQIVTATTAGIDLDPVFPNIYVLDLAQPIPIALQAEVSSIYLRAFPSYVSNVLNVPPLGNSQLGPFLLDFVASPLDSIPSYDETFAIRTLDASGTILIEGGANYFETVDHNHPVVNRQIYAENMIFWDMVRGYGGFLLPNTFLMTCTEQLSSGDWVARCYTRLVPPLVPGITYNLTVSANTAGSFIVIPYPYPAVNTTLTNGTPTLVSFSTPPGGAPITRLDFIYKTNRQDTQVQISDISLPVDTLVSNFQYSYVFKVLGSTNFQATSVIIKPYFLSLDDLSATYDSGQAYNSGFIYLD